MRNLRTFSAVAAGLILACTASADPKLTGQLTGQTVSNASATTTSTNITYIPPTANDDLNDFDTAFAKWNLTQGGVWTLDTIGTALDNTTVFDVTTYQAFVSGSLGGVTIQVAYTQGTGAPDPINADSSNTGGTNTAFWIQAISTSDPLGGNTSPYMDINAAGPFNPPLYPYQYIGSGFYDQPSRYATNTWTGYDYLCTRDTANHTITLDGGIQYGFAVTSNVPGPPAPVTAALIGGLGTFVRRRKTRKVAA